MLSQVHIYFTDDADNSDVEFVSFRQTVPLRTYGQTKKSLETEQIKVLNLSRPDTSMSSSSESETCEALINMSSPEVIFSPRKQKLQKRIIALKKK